MYIHQLWTLRDIYRDTIYFETSQQRTQVKVPKSRSSNTFESLKRGVHTCTKDTTADMILSPKLEVPQFRSTCMNIIYDCVQMNFLYVLYTLLVLPHNLL